MILRKRDMGVKEIKSSQQFRQIAGENRLSVVDFYAVWCGPCKMVAPMFDQLSNRYTDVNFLRVDVDQLAVS